MLTYLAIKNVSVFESASFELGSGLNVLTGETGSGKSVLVGALKLLLGERFQKNMLREGSDKLMVEGVFDNVSPIPEDLKSYYSIEDEFIIRREVDNTGKNRIFINGRLATVAQLREFAPYLADIHGQHEHQTLMNEARHLDLIDHMVPRFPKETYKNAYKAYRQAKEDYAVLLANIEDVRKHQEIVEFQLAEIKSAQINLEEDKGLEDKINFLSHIEKIREGCSTALETLSDGEINAVELMSKSLRSLLPLTGMAQEVNSAVEALSLSLENAGEAVRKLSSLLDQQEASPEELDRLIQRKYILQELIKKYGGSLEAVLIKEEELLKKLSSFENSDEEIKKLESRVQSLEEEARKASLLLLEARQVAAGQISVRVERILEDLALPASRFIAVFNTKDTLDSRGGSEARFYLSVNKGFEPAPLAQIASGGEISRVMLALKEVFSDSDPVSTMLFDEIDTGISGLTARKVADKLKALSLGKQIIVITHLPVVAAAGGTHFYIKKDAAGDITKTTINVLGYEERKKVIASMIAGEPTQAALTQASELLGPANVN